MAFSHIIKAIFWCGLTDVMFSQDEVLAGADTIEEQTGMKVMHRMISVGFFPFVALACYLFIASLVFPAVAHMLDHSSFLVWFIHAFFLTFLFFCLQVGWQGTKYFYKIHTGEYDNWSAVLDHHKP